MSLFVPLPRTTFGRDVLSNLDEALEREWLVTNGIGGYASASLAGANTRRYHGLLVAALRPPLDRRVLLGKLDEDVTLDGEQYALDVNEWGDFTTSTAGLDYLESADFDGTLPTFSYRIGAGTLLKTIWMEYGANTTYVRYSYDAPDGNKPITLRVRPFVNDRDYHGETHYDANQQYRVTAQLNGCAIQARTGARRWQLRVFDAPATFNPTVQSWYHGFRYRQEQARGFDGVEDMYCIGAFTAILKPGQTVTFVASTEETLTVVERYDGALERERARQSALLAMAESATDAFSARLVLAADQFIVGRPDPDKLYTLQPDYRTVLAGYPWFTDWGRDSMIALPGLTLSTGRAAEAATILRSFARSISQGMLPNRFPDAGEKLGDNDYNTVDATLWYFYAISRYLDATDDHDFAYEILPVLTDIVRWHVQGTRYGIKVDPEDGLLNAGQPGVQLTWMDVKIGDNVITPRYGKPVEINALWYFACRMLSDMAGMFGSPEMVSEYAAMATKIKANFERTFWNEAGGYFYDVVGRDGTPDVALRPNQVIALAVAPELVSPVHMHTALATVKAHLYTPYGLRSLSPEDPAYIATYAGNYVERDSAYHQGTVWPWLLGPYARALLNNPYAPDVELSDNPSQTLEALLAPFRKHINAAGVGQISEVFGAEPPYPPGGCIAQAWSVAQLLEILEIAEG